MRISSKILFFLFLALCSAGCVKDKPDEPNQSPINTQGRRIWIANEGSLGNGNASLALLFPEKDSLYDQVFDRANQQPLGDILQSLLQVGDHLFLAVNNSDKIKVIDKHSFKLIGSISIRKPRYMLALDSTKMYVSSLYYPEINIIDPQTLQVKGEITIDYPNSEGLMEYNGKVYACNWDTACNYLYEIDPKTDQITHRIPLAGYAPQQALSDKNGNIWVFAGNVEKSTPATLTCIDPQSQSIIKSYHFPAEVDILKPVWNAGRDTLYFLGVNYKGHTYYDGVFRMAIDANTLPTQAFIPAQALQYFWGLGIDTITGNIYVGDPKGFIQMGAILEYNPKGKLLNSYKTGVGPGYFLFEK